MTSMHAVHLCLILIALACLGSLLARLVKVPLPFVQTAVGAAVALPPISLHLPLDPDTFLLLFVPLLLFGDGWRLSRRELLASRWSVLGHAVGLVFLTVLAGGYALHWLIPGMSLSVAFALAALVSPTDAVALSSITAFLAVPRRMKHLLESEALLNDASGLVAMRFAVAATLSGGFSFLDATGAFLFVALGGLAVGMVLTLLYSELHRRFLVRERDAALQTLLAGLLPFAAFGVAEELGTSGILAAVAAGVTASRLSFLEHAHFSARIQTGVTWDVVSFCLNGIIFVLQGLQLPDIIGSGPAGIDLLTSDTRLAVMGDIVALTALLIVVRLIWVLASFWLGRLLGQSGPMESWRVIAASSIAGVRGAVTLAGALSIPLALRNGTPFPDRDLSITLAMGVILCSMLIASIGLPLLLRNIASDKQGGQNETKTARVVALEAAMAAVTASRKSPGPREITLLAAYREQLASLRDEATAGEDEAWRELHRTALHAERGAVRRLRGKGQIDDTVARQLLGELDILEAALMHRPFRPPVLQLPAVSPSLRPARFQRQPDLLRSRAGTGPTIRRDRTLHGLGR